jgi:hypothetical protein
LKFIKYNEDKNYLNKLKKIQEKYPENIEILESLNQNQLAEEYKKSHLVLSIPKND